MKGFGFVLGVVLVGSVFGTVSGATESARRTSVSSHVDGVFCDVARGNPREALIRIDDVLDVIWSRSFRSPYRFEGVGGYEVPVIAMRVDWSRGRDVLGVGDYVWLRGYCDGLSG